MSELVDQVARTRIRTELDKTFFVEAAAGAGKTTELVERMIALIRSGKGRLSQLVAITFTEKAAGEMKLRLRREIERARIEPGISAEEQARFVKAIEELEVAHLGTIHAFCADLLRERPVEAQVDPLFEVADEFLADRIAHEAFAPFFARALASSNPPEGIRRLLRRRPRDGGGEGPSRALFEAGRRLIDHRDFRAPFARPPFEREKEIDQLLATLEELGQCAAKATVKDSWFTKSIEAVARFIEELHRREKVRPRDYDGLEFELAALSQERSWGWKVGRNKWFADGMLMEQMGEQRSAALASIKRLLERADADLAACIQQDLWPFVDAYEERKQRRGALDFLDLLQRARDLLSQSSAVREELQSRFTHVLVDEFQDTDPLQAEIVLLLSADNATETDLEKLRPCPGKLFCVGDPKQAIYRFRRADVVLYTRIKDRLVGSGAAEVLHLTTSFRSVPAIQQAVNATFIEKMIRSPDGSQCDYVALTAFRDAIAGQPALIALPVGRPYSEWGGKITKQALEEGHAKSVGGFVDYLVNKSGWKVREEGALVPIAARHICLLFRRFQSFGADLTDAYVRELDRNKIAHVLVGGRSFHEREEVAAIRNVLGAIEWPDDEFSVFASLRGPFFGFSDDALFAAHETLGPLNPVRTVPADAITEVTRPVHEALQILRELHRARNRRSVADTLTEFLERTRAQAQLALWPNGERALANVSRILDLARSFESRGTTSFRAFVTFLQEQEGKGGADAPVLEEGVDGVRMMTVHKAKGLEFPIVFLVDIGAGAQSARPSRFVDTQRGLCAVPLANCVPHDLVLNEELIRRHDAEESLRLSYVAATRASDLLVVPVLGDPPHSLIAQSAHESWCDVFGDAFYPAPATFKAPERFAGIPEFKRESVLARGEWSNVPASQTIQPGLHHPRKGDHSVLWWDPSLFELAGDADVGLRHQRVLGKADSSLHAVREGERIHAEWVEAINGARNQGSRPTHPFVTVSALKGSVAIGQTSVVKNPARVERLERKGPRPRGKRFGTLVHAVLATIPLDAKRTSIEKLAAMHANLLLAPPDELSAAVSLVEQTLAHPLILEASASADARRECSVHFEHEGELVEGIIDLVYQRADQVWMVIDFKTDDDLAPRLSSYEVQLELYCEGIERVTRGKSEGVLLSI